MIKIAIWIAVQIWMVKSECKRNDKEQMEALILGLMIINLIMAVCGFYKI